MRKLPLSRRRIVFLPSNKSINPIGMKKYIVLFVMLLASFGVVNAQAENGNINPNDIRPLTLKQLYDNLELEMNQFKVLKTFYADSNKDRLDRLRVTTDEDEIATIELETLVRRDDKIRSILTDEQLLIYNRLQRPVIDDPSTTVGEEPNGGGK